MERAPGRLRLRDSFGLQVRWDVFGLLRQTVETMWPGVPVIPSMSAGASDSI